jgi:thiol-disulfide isomerase/thioredoxin
MSKQSRTVVRICVLFAWAWLGAGDALPAIGVAATAERATGSPLPEFTHAAPADWINSAPLTLADLHGHVVLLHVWAFECWNCYRSFPWLESAATRYAPQGFEVIGVHSPEFEREMVRQRRRESSGVRAHIPDHAGQRPVVLARARTTSTGGLVPDRPHRRRSTVVVGETHAGDARRRWSTQSKNCWRSRRPWCADARSRARRLGPAARIDSQGWPGWTRSASLLGTLGARFSCRLWQASSLSLRLSIPLLMMIPSRVTR